MLAAWRAVCLAALSAALAATLATGDDAGAGETVRDFGLVCAVFRNVLQARGVAKAQKARADEVALAIEHAWLGEAREDLEEDVVVTAADEQTRKAEAKRLKGQAEELAEKIDALSYSAILGEKGNQPDKAEDENNVLFGKIAGSGTNTGFADAQSGTALSNDMMWLCNVAGATAKDNTQPFKSGDDTSCPCTKDRKAKAYLKSGEFWKKLKAETGSAGAQASRKAGQSQKGSASRGKKNTLTKDQTRKPLSAAHDLSTAVTRVMAAIDTDGKSNPTKKFCLGQRVNSQTCDGNTHATACVCYDQHKGHIPWSDKIAEMETQLEALQDVMTQLDQLQPRQKVSTARAPKKLHAQHKHRKPRSKRTQNNAQAMARTHKTPRPSNAGTGRNAPQRRAKTTTRKRQRWQDRETQNAGQHTQRGTLTQRHAAPQGATHM
ncbi:Trypanosomal VSG domain [Trypanosoma vivax]|nr:Trypanosomal VSG domain [Trypanosoma vivax]